MKAFLWQFFEYAINMFQSYYIIDFVIKCNDFRLDKKKNKLIFISMIAFLWLSITFSNLIISYDPISPPIFALVIFIASLYIFEGKPLKKLVISIVPVFATGIVATFTVQLISLLLGASMFEIFTSQNSIRLTAVLLGQSLTFYVITLIKQFFTRKALTLKNIEWSLIVTIFVISLIIGSFLTLMHSSFTSEYMDKLLLFLSILGLSIINIFVFNLIIRINTKNALEIENTLLKEQFFYQSQYASNVKNDYEQIKHLHHDLKSNLYIIDSLLDKNDPVKTREFLKKYIDRVDNINQYIQTENEYLNAIINIKLTLAKNHNIDVSVSCSSEINSIDNMDICILFGNLLDNSIEATQKCVKQPKLIKISITSKEDSVIIAVKNTIEQSVLSKNPKLKTIKEDKSKHGYGVKAVKDIIKKYDGHFKRPSQILCKPPKWCKIKITI
jgi:two-component system sensor histidine kinase AgrC